MNLRTIKSIMLASFMLVVLPVSADDGEINNKSMSKTINVPDFDQAVVNEALPVSDHAFTDWMKFYVPAQQASGAPAGETEDGLIIYNDIDGNLVEALPVAKPLINVFIYGPDFEVDGTAFGHSFMDTYAAVSLDDGVTFKETNLSDSATESSFNLETDHNPGGHDPLPNDHTILLGSMNNGAWHKPGYDFPYTAHCSECHGSALQGTAGAPSCYSCHGNRWEEDTPIELGPIVTSAIFKNGKLQGAGENAASKVEVTIINGVTGHEIVTTDATNKGAFSFNVQVALPPCTVAAFYEDPPLDNVQGPAITVTDKNGEPLEDCEGLPINVVDYPGGTYNVFHATAGNKTLVAWPSRFCSQGQPAYQMTTPTNPDEERLAAIVAFLQNGDTELGVPALPDFSMEDDLYLVDAFGVAGSQGSSDFADEGYPQVGVVPFGCVWATRGILLPGDDPRTEENVEESHMVWTKAERLTSGRRDPNRIEVSAVQDAGFVITWQEDPEGLRPGQGLGPGEGWSGAVAHSQTDVWYSFINSEYFGIVEDPDSTTTPVDVLDHDLLLTGRPQVFVPMAVPMRVTNNAKCNPPADDTTPTTDDLYCDGALAAPYGIKNQCADTVIISTGSPTNPKETEICVVDTDGDGDADLPNRANTASTRPRLSLQGYDPSVDDKSAWVIFATEESKGLGKFFFTPDGLDGGGFDGLADPCEEDSSEDCTEEIGKNQWYHSFDMGTPDTSAGIGVADSLVESLVFQGDMLNQSEVYWETGEFYGLMDTSELGEDGGSLYGDYDFQIANTEIARRASLLAQGLSKATASSGKLMATPSWKQGVMRQGGPADTMLRRIVLPEVFDAAVDNPYAFANMVCEEWQIDAGINPYYPGGLCADPATNLSGVVPDTCIDSDTGGGIDCPTVDFTTSTYGIGDTQPILQGLVQGEGNTMKVLTWHQCPSDGVQFAGDITAVTCDTDLRDDDFVNLADQSWYNPLDVSKGHRGFIDGDFVMFLYAWSPNWRLNAKGSDRYELYVRRSFDGGNTWSTTPSGFTASDGNSYPADGTVTCESYRSTETGTGEPSEPKVCYEFTAGAAEHARNVTQHKSMRITTLDPRYAISGSPRGVSITEDCTDGLFLDATVIEDIWTCDDTSEVQDTDLRNPSRYFMVFETGDNTTVTVGEAEPLDLFYGRAESFGDDYTVWTETDTDTADATVCYPSDPHDVLDISDVIIGSGFCNEFDNLNTGGDTHASEASLGGNPDGSKMYGVWAQWVFDESGEEVVKSDAQARRVWWLDDYISDTNAYTLPGTQ